MMGGSWVCRPKPVPKLFLNQNHFPPLACLTRCACIGLLRCIPGCAFEGLGEPATGRRRRNGCAPTIANYIAGKHCLPAGRVPGNGHLHSLIASAFLFTWASARVSGDCRAFIGPFFRRWRDTSG
jgi:hypothetical protein